MKIIKEGIHGLDSIDNLQPVENVQLASAQQFSEKREEEIDQLLKENGKEVNLKKPFLGAEKQPLPPEPILPKLNLDESLMEDAYDGGSDRGGVDWDYYDKFKDIINTYMLPQGEGDTKASQAVTAMNKLVYKWYNDGDVFDNNYGMDGWANDLSSYANWLYKYVPEVADDLERITDGVMSDAAYERLLKSAAEKVFDEGLLSRLAEEAKTGSIYDCNGPFMFTEKYECENCGEAFPAEELIDGLCPDCYDYEEEEYEDEEEDEEGFDESYKKGKSSNALDRFNAWKKKTSIKGSLKESVESASSEDFPLMYKGSWFTVEGAGGDLSEWEEGIQGMLDEENIGHVKEWKTFRGADMNEWAHLSGSNAYPEDLVFLAFPLDGLDIGKLAMFKLRFDARWFDDIVDNNADREGYHPVEREIDESFFKKFRRGNEMNEEEKKIKEKIAKYRQVSGLKEDVQITEDNINEWCLKRACNLGGWDYKKTREQILRGSK